VTKIEAINEPTSLGCPILGNYASDSYFGNFIAQVSGILETQRSKITLQIDSCLEGKDRTNVVSHEVIFETKKTKNRRLR